MAKEKWLQKGTAGEERSKQLVEERKANYAAKSLKDNRIWLKAGTGGKFTFLDSEGAKNEGAFLYEHALYRNGNWFNYETCLKDFSECPLCDVAVVRQDKKEKISGGGVATASYIAVYTVIDHRENKFEKRDGTKVVEKHVKRLLVCKTTVINKIARRRKEMEDKSLFGCTFEFNRDSADECSTGEDIQFSRKLNKKQILSAKPKDVSDEEWLAPFDYDEIFKPKSVEELRKLVGSGEVIGAEDNSESNEEESAGEGTPKAKELDDLL